MIFLRPPEKLVIEVKATGRFRFVQWQKNAVQITLTEESFSNHFEIYFRDQTTTDDLTLYEVSLRPASGGSQRTLPGELDFSVTPPGNIFDNIMKRIILFFLIIVDANTTANNQSAVAVLEGDSIILSCTSFGAPVPTITWEFSNQPVEITPIESATESVATLIRDPLDSSSFIPNIITGDITSSIQIVNASYPEDDGVYTCIGSNDNQMLNTSEDTITLQVIGR